MAETFQEKELKAYIDTRLKDQTFLKALYKELRLTHTKEEIEKLDDQDLYKIIVKHGLLESLIKEGADINQMRTGDEIAEDNIPLDDVNLKITVIEGKGFTDYMDNSERNKKVRVGISFLRNRKLTKPVDASLQPLIDQTFLMSFGSIFEANQTTFDYLLKLKSPLSISLIEENNDTGNRKLLSEKNIEWRFLLSHRSLTMNLEMASVNGFKPVFGLLRVNIQLVTKGGKKVKISEESLDAQLELESKHTSLKAAQFFDFSQSWYNEYRSIKPDFSKRAVKIYADHNTGSSHDQKSSAPKKPIFTYISKLRVRGIDSPEHAARFVSLIPFRKADNPDNALGQWRYFHSFLVEGRGEVQDHASLLCSLLLGFGLDAYVCVGSCTDGAHCWVLTRHIEKVI